MQGKARDILILWRITDFSTTGSTGLKRRNNGRNMYYTFNPINIHYIVLLLNNIDNDSDSDCGSLFFLSH
jgi:hypothetical protein